MTIKDERLQTLSLKLARDPNARKAFLGDPAGVARGLGVALKAADSRRIARQAQRIKSSGWQGDLRYQRGIILVISNGGFGADESADRRWTPQAAAGDAPAARRRRWLADLWMRMLGRRLPAVLSSETSVSAGGDHADLGR